MVAKAETQDTLWGESAALGVSRRFDGQDLKAYEEVQVAADADLLNLSALRASIEAKGQPAPASVAGVLAVLYSMHGVDFVHKLDGAFSFALWDKRRRRLIIAIDRLGIKNIYWRMAKGRLTFASRLSPLKLFDSSLALNEAALAQFLLFSAVPAPLTIYEGTEKMRPGFVLIFENDRLEHHRYWDLQFREERRPEAEWAELVRHELRASVHRHLAASTPEKTGAFLSGGTDSSTVVAFMSERQKPVHTFSIVFKEGSYSEASFVRTVVQRFGTDQHESCLSPRDALDAIPRIAAYYDEPFANSSTIAAYFCGVMARQNGVEQMLGGDGGDELFAGNQRYETDKYFALYHRLPQALRRMLIEPMAGLLPREHRWLGLPARYISRALIPNPQRFFSRNFFFSLPPEEIFAAGVLEKAPRAQWLQTAQGHFDQVKDSSELNRLLYLDVKMALADNDLKKVSGMAELSGVRVRYPLLDHRLVQLAGRIPVDLKLRGLQKRYIFKKAMTGILPDQVLYKKKHGMGVPVSSWLLTDPQLHALALDVLHDTRTRQRGYFRAGFIDRLLNLQRNEHTAFYGEIVWYLLTLELWHREHLSTSLPKAACADD
ncbi:MAG TPA: asparagine synthase-related protein [Candidatus Angelobacter sp.]